MFVSVIYSILNVMVFHSSIGEESGGGYLGVDAIWSHRYYVFDENSEPVSIAGSSVKLSGYTINPIDASIGVVAHEFGHDLGLADEYDLQSNTVGEPVSSWSIMSTGSWAGGPRGSQPVMFSAQALEYLQNRYQGNWVNQLNLTMEEVSSQPQQSLVYTSSLSQQQSQIKVTLAHLHVKTNHQLYTGLYRHNKDLSRLYNYQLKEFDLPLLVQGHNRAQYCSKLKS